MVGLGIDSSRCDAPDGIDGDGSRTRYPLRRNPARLRDPIQVGRTCEGVEKRLGEPATVVVPRADEQDLGGPASGSVTRPTLTRRMCVRGSPAKCSPCMLGYPNVCLRPFFRVESWRHRPVIASSPPE